MHHLVVHLLNEHDIWKDSDPKAAWLAVTPTPAPNEGVFVRVPILRNTRDSLLNFHPGVEPSPLQSQRAQDFPPWLDQVQIGRVFWLEDNLPAGMGQVEQEHIEGPVDIEVVHHSIDPLGGGVDPALDPAQPFDRLRSRSNGRWCGFHKAR
jgi:hypothetical protein